MWETRSNCYSLFHTRLQTVCLNPNLNHFFPEHTSTPTHTFLEIQLRRILSNLSSLISPLTHVYQRCAPDGYLGNQTGSVGGQGFQVLLLCSLRFPLVALQEKTQQQEWGLITRLTQKLPQTQRSALTDAPSLGSHGVSFVLCNDRHFKCVRSPLSQGHVTRWVGRRPEPNEHGLAVLFFFFPQFSGWFSSIISH